MELTDQENLALAMLENTPAVIQHHFKGKVQVPMNEVVLFYEKLSRSLRLSEAKRAQSFAEAEVILG